MAHLHDVIDDDLHFKIDPETRKISRTSENPIIIVQNDHNSERLTFEIPNEIDGHGMKLCDKVKIHFINFDAANPTNNTAGFYESDDLDVLEGDDNTLVFTWLVRQESTRYAGPLNFAISFQCTSEETDANGDTQTVIEYSWNTSPNTEDVSVSTGMDNSDAVIEKYYDSADSVLATWLSSIEDLGKTTTDAVTNHANATKSAVEKSITAAGNTAMQGINKHAEEVKIAIANNPLSGIGSVITQGTGSATDKVMSQDATTKAVEAAKVHANTKISETEARLNQKNSSFTDTLSKSGKYKEVPLNKAFELGKAYKIITNKPASTGEWGFKILYAAGVNIFDSVTGMMSLQTGESPYISAETFIPRNHATFGIDNITVSDKPTISGSSNYASEFVIRMLGYDVEYSTELGSGIVKINLRYDLNDNNPKTLSSAGAIKIVVPASSVGKPWSIESDECDVGIFPDDGVTVTVYEINDDPASVSAFKVNANGISDISKTGTSGLTDTYTINFDDGTKTNFTVKNGDGIAAMNSNPDGDETIYKITRDSGREFEFKVPNSNSIGVKTHASGPAIHAEDVIPMEHFINVKARSINLIEYPYIARNATINGITFTSNDDGSVTASGTASDYATFNLADVSNTLKNGVTYTIGDLTRVILSYRDTTDDSMHYVRNESFTWSDKYQFVQLYIQYSPENGTVNDTIYPYLCVEGEADGYTPYAFVRVDADNLANGKVPILTKCGKNMFDPSKLLKASGWTVADGVYSGLPEKLHDTFNPDNGEAFNVGFESNTQYTLSFRGRHDGDIGEETVSFGFYYTDGTISWISVNETTMTDYVFTSDANKTVSKLCASFHKESVTYLKDIQLEKGPVATTYEPFTAQRYIIYPNGQPAGPVMSVSPTMTLFADKPGVIIDATYNVDQTAAFNKCEARVDAKIAELQAMIDSLKAT